MTARFQAPPESSGAEPVAKWPKFRARSGTRNKSGPNPERGGRVTSEEAVEGELKALRRVGLRRYGELELPALRAACRQILAVGPNEPFERNHLERLLRRAIGTLGTSEIADAAETLFGLKEGYRGLAPHRLRRVATEIFYENSSEANKEAFRKTWEAKRIIPEIAAAICSLGSAAPDPTPAPNDVMDMLIERYRDLADMAVIVRHPGSRVTAGESHRWIEARGRLRDAADAMLSAVRNAADGNPPALARLEQLTSAITDSWLTPYDEIPSIDFDEFARLTEGAASA